METSLYSLQKGLNGDIELVINKFIEDINKWNKLDKEQKDYDLILPYTGALLYPDFKKEDWTFEFTFLGNKMVMQIERQYGTKKAILRTYQNVFNNKNYPNRELIEIKDAEIVLQHYLATNNKDHFTEFTIKDKKGDIYKFFNYQNYPLLQEYIPILLEYFK